GKDGQADAPADDGGALDCLGVGKILQIPLAETYDERAQVGVLEHVCAGIAGIESVQLGGRRVDGRDIDGVGREAALQQAHASGGLAGSDASVVEGCEDRVGSFEQAV